MGASTERIAIDIQTSANVQPVKDLNTALQGTLDESKELSRIMREQGLSMEQAAKKIVELRSATQSLGAAAASAASAGGGSGGGGAPPGAGGGGGGLGSVPAIIDRTNRQIDAMAPRMRSASLAFSNLAFVAGGFDGSLKSAVSQVGLLSFSLADLMGAGALGAAAIGGLTTVVTAGIGIWERYEAQEKRVRDRTTELNEAHVRLLAEFRGNKLGEIELTLNQQYLKQVQAIQKDQPGMLARAWAEILAGAGVLTGSSSLLRASFDSYLGRQLTLGGQTGQAQQNRTQAEANARQEAEREAARRAEEAAKRLAAAQQRAFDAAARFTAEDLSNNDVFLKTVGPKWTAMWQRFAEDAAVRKETTDIIKKMMQEPFITAASELQNVAQSGVSGALQGLQNLKEQGPLLGRGFGGPQGEFKREFDEVTKGAMSMSATLGKLAADQLPLLATGFTRVFSAIGHGKEAFKTLSDVALGAIERVAAGMAATEFAEGIAMVARSIWDFLGPNPAAGASATQHFAAAGLFSAIAGGAAAAGGLGGGYGYGGGGSSGGGGGGTFVPNNQQPGGNQTIIIHIGDVSNPALVNTLIYEINRSDMLGKPVIAPYGRPS